MEGTRPVLVEVQSSRRPGRARHAAACRRWLGWYAARDDHGGSRRPLRVVGRRHDIYLNVAGGLRIVEPAADLAVAAALVSALKEIPVPADTVVFGEIAL